MNSTGKNKQIIDDASLSTVVGGTTNAQLKAPAVAEWLLKLIGLNK